MGNAALVALQRCLIPRYLSGEALTAAMVGIGMNLAARGAKDPNIEDTLLFAARAALEQDGPAHATAQDRLRHEEYEQEEERRIPITTRTSSS